LACFSTQICHFGPEFRIRVSGLFLKSVVFLPLILLGMAIAIIQSEARLDKAVFYMTHLQEETKSWQNHCFFAKPS